MNELDLTAIKARADAATGGPWKVGPPIYRLPAYESGGGSKTVIAPSPHCATSGGVRTPFVRVLASWTQDADIEFMAHARQDIPALIAEVERLRLMSSTFQQESVALREENEP